MSATPFRIGTLIALITVLALLALVGHSMGQEHGTGLLNTGNDMALVVGGADNPLGMAPGDGSMLVHETVHMRNDHIPNGTDYGIVFVPSAFEVEAGYPRVLALTRDYTVTSYTLVLSNATENFTMEVRDLDGEGFAITQAYLDEVDPAVGHPRANATYSWRVVVVDSRGYNLTQASGGNVTVADTGDTTFDLGALELPSIGDHHWEAGEDDLAELNTAARLERHERLTAGFYRFRVEGVVFEYGVNVTISLRYSAELASPMEVEKLIFTSRPIDIHLYVPADLDVVVYTPSVNTDAEAVLPPLEDTESGGTRKLTYYALTTFRIVLGGEEDEGTDWATVGRYVVLFAIVAALIALVLFSGPKERGADEEEGAEEEEGTDREEEEEERD